jgi:hypothetical protein
MTKQTNKTNPRVTQIFNDLDKYRNFCRDFGYRFDEADLYANRSYVWRQYTKSLAGKEVKDQWAVQLERMNG